MTRRYRFVVYQDRKKEWRWRLVASNGKIVADSAEGYKKKSHAVKMIRSVLDAVRDFNVWTTEAPKQDVQRERRRRNKGVALRGKR